MPMCDGQNPNQIAYLHIGNVMRKSLQIRSPVSAELGAGDIGMPNDPQDILIHLVPESLT